MSHATRKTIGFVLFCCVKMKMLRATTNQNAFLWPRDTKPLKKMVRFSDDRTAVFVELLQAASCLWDVASANYHRRDIRHAAMQRMAVAIREEGEEVLNGERSKIRSGEFPVYRPRLERYKLFSVSSL